MARKTTLQPLTLPEATNVGDNSDYQLDSPTSRSPFSQKSPRSPRSPFKFTTKKSHQNVDHPYIQGTEAQTSRQLAYSQTVPSLSTQQYTDSYRGQDQEEARERGGFFSNYKASKSSSRLQQATASLVRQEGEDNMSRDTDRPTMGGKVSSGESNRSDPYSDRSVVRKPVGGPSTSLASLGSTESPPTSTTESKTNPRKNKPKPFSLLGRSRSIRDEQSPVVEKYTQKQLESEKNTAYKDSMKTAPIRSENDRSFRDMMSSSVRQRSEDRVASTRDRDAKDGKPPQMFSSSFQGSSHGFLNNLKSSATKGAGALHKGLFGKGGRGVNEKEPTIDDEHYQLKVINLPLVKQTRLTRISKKLEDSRDKTEFWMPAFPWRAIDYLNYKGSDVEGLYRVPGSGPQIKKWQRRFDEELDIDLFEQDDLYDINIIGSMLKAWLRELPDELLPKDAQDRIARECAGAEKVPQMLIDELSNLSPFNYYLLFAITCHLSLLLAHSEKNKMDFRNLCICFQPCMKMDAFCFKFLVCDWRDCWKGCLTESFYIEQEYELFDMGQIPPGSAEGRSSTAVDSPEERNISSSDSSKPSSVSADLQKSIKFDKTMAKSNKNAEAQKKAQAELKKIQAEKVQAEKKAQSEKKALEKVQAEKEKKAQAEKRAQVEKAAKAQKESQDKAQSQRFQQHSNHTNLTINPTVSNFQLDGAGSSASLGSSDTVGTTLTIQETTPPRKSADMRPLSPIKPLSPIGF